VKEKVRITTKGQITISRFEQFRGIGNPGIPSGRKGIIRFMRKLRGH
jgi:hypothetical protein